ncbi:MAG: tetratricopeptide repeat protein [Cytophagales bacterium]|nr:tetratricopeptide repeat protein [Bernardetiaceae bacterium]MDW8203551.1 tetratricopeptide repeat protein [Cytophagales bacterium]
MRKYFLLNAFYFLLPIWGIHAQAGDEPSALEYFAKAEKLRTSKRFIEALEMYDRAISLENENFKYYHSKALCYYGLKDLPGTIQVMEKCLQLKKDFVPGLLLLAQCYKLSQKNNEYIIALDNAFKYETDLSKKVDYKTNIVIALLRNKEYARAKPHVLQARSLSPSDINLMYFEGKIYNELNDFKAAKEILSKLISTLNEKDPKVAAKYYYEIGYACYKLGQFELAFDYWKNAEHGNFKNLVARYNPRTYLAAALCYSKMYEFGKARENLEIALKIQPNLTPAYVLQAEIAKKELKQDAVISAYQQALVNEIEPAKKGEICKALAQALMESQRFTDVVNITSQGLKYTPGDYQMLFLQAMAYYRAKQYVESLKVLEIILGNQSLDAESRALVHFAMATIYRLMNQPDKAKAAYKKAEVGSFARTVQLEMADMEGTLKAPDFVADDIPLPETQ